MVTLPATLDVSVLVSWDASAAFTGDEDDVTAAVAIDPGVSLDEGRDGVQQLSPPKIAAGAVDLHNDDGTYSQEQPTSPIYQRVLPGRPVQFQATHGVAGLYTEHALYREHEPYRGVGLYPLGRHVIDDISQTNGWGNRRVGLSTLGYEVVLTRATVTVALMVAPRVDECFTALLDAVSWPDDKRDIAVSDTQLLYWWCDERHPWDAMLELLQSEGPGAFYISRDGKFHFENRNFRTIADRSTTSQATFRDVSSGGGRSLYTEHRLYREHALYAGYPDLWFTSLRYDPGFKSVFNRATYATRRRTTGSLQKVWEYGATLTLSANQSRTLFARPTDPFLAAVAPVAATDYTVTTGSATVTLTYSSGFVAFIVVTAGPSGATIDGVTSSGLQLRAQPLTVVSETTAQNSVDASASIEQFSPVAGQAIPLPLTVSGWSEIDPAQAEGVCDSWVVRQQIPRPAVTITIRNADANHLEQILRRTESDRITLVEANTGLAADVWINSIQLTISGAGGRVVEATLGCEMCDAIVGAVWDDPDSLWDSPTTRWGV